MPSVSYDFVPGQTVYVVDSGVITSGAVVRVDIRVIEGSPSTTVTYWINIDGLTTEYAEDVVYESCQSAAGYQDVNFGGTAVSTATAYTPTGSPLPATLDATITIDGAIGLPASFTGNGPTLTFLDIINGLNGMIAGWGTASIVDGNIRIQSNSKGATSSVSIADTNLFSSLNGYVQIDTAVAGVTDGALEALGSQVC